MGFLYRVTPATKTLVMFIFAIATTTKQDPSVALPVLAYLLAVVALGGVSLKLLVHDILPIAPFLVGLPLGNAIITWIRGGDPLAVAVKVLSMLGVLVLLAAMFAYTTDPDDFAYSLARQFRLPVQFAFSVGLTYSFLTYALLKYRRVIEALRARWLVKSPLDTIRYFVPVLVSVMHAISRRVDNLTIAMEMKGFGREGRTFWREPKAGFEDYALLATSAAVALVARVLLPLLL